METKELDEPRHVDEDQGKMKKEKPLVKQINFARKPL